MRHVVDFLPGPSPNLTDEARQWLSRAPERREWWERARGIIRATAQGRTVVLADLPRCPICNGFVPHLNMGYHIRQWHTERKAPNERHYG